MADDRNRLIEYDKLCQEATKKVGSGLYDEAESLFNQAIECNPQPLDAYMARSNVYIKLEKFDLSRKDAERVIQALRPKQNDPSTHNVLASAFMKGGVASFRLGEYGRAKDFFKEGMKFDSSTNTGFNQWLIWCDEKIAKFAVHGKKAEANEKIAKANEQPKADDSCQQNIPMPPPKIKHDWYQTETTVVVEVRIKGLDKTQVKVEFDKKSLVRTTYTDELFLNKTQGLINTLLTRYKSST